PIVFTTPTNGLSAEIKGLEVQAQSRLTFLPEGWMQNFGAQANYTYASSSADFGAEGDVRSSGLPGLSKHSVNASLYYDDQRFSARLAYAWRSEYLHAFSGAWGVPRFQNAYGQLDLSATYEVFENLHLQLQVLNLTNNTVSFTSDAIKWHNNVTQLDRRILFGARYSF
ncbi:MAG: TonB-dependent receptor, partial [Kordiimonas sp.]